MNDDIVIRIRGRNDAGDAYAQANRATDGLRRMLRQTEDAAERTEAALDDIGDARDEIDHLVGEFADLVDQLQTLQRESAQASSDLGEVADAADDAGQGGESSFGGMTDALSGGLGGAVEGVTGALQGMGPVGAAAAAAITVGIGLATAAAAKLKDALVDALKAAMERQDVGAEIAASLGSRGGMEAVAAFGKQAGRVYAAGFGDSLEDSGAAVKNAMRFLVDDDATDAMIEDAAGKISTLAHLVESDTAEAARAASKMLKTGLAGSYTEAIDLITRASEQGVNEADDLLDTVSEYSIQFKQLGLSGQEALGLLSQGLKGGARDADTVADALKEIAIRAQDGSAASAAAFKGLGLDAKKLGPMFAKGGESARLALDMVIDKAKGIKDPMQQNALAAGLFGTKAEDLQDALFGLDLDGAAEEMAGFEGATQRASDTLSGTLSGQIDSLQRKFEMLKADLGDKIAPTVQKVIDRLTNFAEKAAPMVTAALDTIRQTWEENREEIDQFRDLLDKVVIPLLGGSLIVAFYLVIGAIRLVIEVMGALGTAWEGFKKTALQVTAAVAGYLGGIATAAANAFAWVPGIGPKMKESAKKVNDFADDVNLALRRIDREVGVTIRARTVGFVDAGNKAAGRATGGVATGLAWVGERGRELVDFGARGGRVFSNGAAETMAASGGGGAQEVTVRLAWDGVAGYDAFLTFLKKTLRVEGAESFGLAPATT